MKILSVLLSFRFLISACSTTAVSRSPQSVNDRIPTAEELFVRGQFGVKKPFLKPWYENHYGEDLDLSAKRPTVDLEGTVFAAKYAKPGYRLQANFFHNDKFYIVRVPEKGVKDVYFQISHFPPEFIAAHILLRIEMDQDHPVEIVAEMPTAEQLDAMQTKTAAQVAAELPAELSGEAYRLENVAISGEAAWSKTDPKKAYDLGRGQIGAYLRVGRFVSMKERLKEFYRSGNPVTQVKMPNTVNLDRVLAVGLAVSQDDGIHVLYNTANVNCDTMAFYIFEKATGAQDPRIGYIRKAIDRRLPVAATNALAQYGGIEVTPMHLDRSLAEESLGAFRDIIVKPHRRLCPPGMSLAHCKNMREADAFLSQVRPNQCHELFAEN